MFNQIKNTLFGTQIGRYFLIGGMASAIDVGVFIVLHEFLDFSAIASHSISIPISAIYSFTLNAFLNFKTTDKLLLRFISFSIVVMLGYLLGALVIWFTENFLGLSGTIGKIISLPLVFVFQYFLNAKISFRN